RIILTGIRDYVEEERVTKTQGKEGTQFSVIKKREKGGAQFWDGITGDPIGPPMTLPGAFSGVAFSPDGRMAAIASTHFSEFDGHPISSDGEVQLWEVATHKPLGRPMLLTGPNPIRTLIFSPDGRTVLTNSGNGKTQLWDTSTSRPTGPAIQHL